MTRITTWLFAAIFVLTFACNSFASHEIMKWRDNRNAAVSVSFDDGYGSQVTIAAPLLNAHNFKGTFYMITESVFWEVGASWDQWRDVAAQGHEIGSHTINHPELTTLDESDMRVELGNSQALIDQNIPTQNCLTLAYPYGDNNDFVQQITSEYYIAGRDVWSSDYLNYYPGGPYVPINFYAIGSLEFEFASQEEVLSNVDLAEERNAWFDTFIHDIDHGDLVQRFTDFLDNISTRNVWVDTTGNIVRYMNERIESTVNVISETDTEIQLDLTHTLDNSIYNIPITMRSTVPLSWNEVEVRQGGLVVDTATAAMETSEAVIYYDVTPNAGLITLAPASVSTSPVISLVPVSLTAASVQGLTVPDQTFTVTNTGAGTLNYTIAVDAGADWLSVSPTSGDAAASEVDTITVSFPTAASLTPAVYTASITVTDANATNSPQVLPVTLTITEVTNFNVTVVTPVDYQVAKLNVGDLYLLDRTYTLTSIPDEIGAGTAEWIMPFNNDKTVTSENHLTFTINQPSTVYVAYDSRATSVPNWLSGAFTSTTSTIGVSESMGHFAVYQQNFTPGSISLGGNMAAGAVGAATNYVVAVKSLGPLVEQCDNAVDDDLDTLIDCADPDCAANPLCSMPTITLIPTALSATSVQGLAVADQIFTVSNTGTGTLNYTIAVDAGADWLSVSPASGDAAATEVDTITVSFPTAASLTPAVYTASITVTDANATNSPQVLPVTLTITTEPTPLISLAPVALTATSPQGAVVADQTFTVSNSGAGTLNYTIAVDAGADWLSVSPTSGDAAVAEVDTITVSFPTASLLTPAVYTASITVTDTNATNSPQVLPVTLTITNVTGPNVTVVTPVDYQMAQLNVADLYLLDRTYTLTSIPEEIGAGTAEWIMPFNDDKTVTSESHLTFTINQPSTVYVAYDSRATSVPNWLSGMFTSSTSTIGVSESMGHFAVYQQNFTPGSISLGGNMAAGAVGAATNYVVAVKSLGPLVEQCNNAVDDDLDTLIDCADPDCAASPLCSMPTITLIPTALSATSVQGLAVADQTFTVSNTGTGTLNYTIAVDAGADWLSVSPASGDAAATEVDTITVSFPAAASLTPAVYTASITVTDANATNSPQVLPVTLTITAEPTPLISLAPVALTATSPQGAVVADQTFTVTNTGAGTLNYTIAVDAGADWLSVSPASGDAAAAEVDTITVSFPTAASLTPAVYTASITVTDANATNSPQVLPVTLTITDVTGPNVAVVTPVDYQVAQLNVADLYLLDRTYTLTSIPDEIGAGTAEWIMPFNDDKTVTSESHLTFTINQPSTVYVAYDSRATSVPNWLSGAFTSTTLTIGVSESMGHFAVYQQNFTPGSISLGGNMAAGAVGAATNYVVAVKSLGPLVEQCNNAVDDDLDTLIDCADPDCAASPLCSMPTITLIPTALSATSVQGLAVADQTFTVSNTGTGTLNYTIAVDAGADWLNVSPASGDAAASEVDTITVSFPTASLLTPAVYIASITVTDANATNSPQVIPVTLTITEEPTPLISLAPVALTATSPHGAVVADQTFTVTNSGAGILNYTIAVDAGADWLSVSPASGDAAAAEVDTITVSFPTAASLTPAVYTASITVTDANATNSPQVLPVTLTITDVTGPNVTVVTPADYQVTQLNVGDLYLLDRTYTLTSIPEEIVAGTAEWIMPFNDDKTVTSESHLTFTINQPSTVYVAYDSRATSVPNWLSGAFTLTSLNIGVSDMMGNFAVYQQNFTPGSITLGGNMAAGAEGAATNYVVIVQP